MAISKAAVVFIAAVLSVPAGKSSKQDKPPTMEDKFYTQVDKANGALDKFLRLDCTDKGNNDAVKDLIVQVTALKEIYQALPTSPNEPANLKASETFVGFIEISNAYVKAKVKACTPDSSAPEDKTPVPASLSTS